MYFSSSSPEEISLEMRKKLRVVILNPFRWIHCVSADLVWMKALLMGQAFLAETSPSCVSFLFSAVWCSAVMLTSQLANALLHYVPHTQDLYLGRSIIYAMQSWD